MKNETPNNYKIEVIGLTLENLERLLDESGERLYNKLKEKEVDKKPSEYEDITVEQAAEELHCSMRTVRRRMKELSIKGYRVGKKISLQRKDLGKIKLKSAS